MSIKSRVASLLGAKNLGRIDYFRRPEYKKVWGGAFNGQEFRRHIFDQLCRLNNFHAIVETGAFRGNTTEFMSKQGLPIVSVEYDARIYGYVSTRFLFRSNVEIVHNDSRKFLRELVDHQRFQNREVFFYLDAHWNEDLPLADEIEIIFAFWPDAVIMIDDFEVPETNYNFDDYGEGRALTLEYLASVKGFSEFSLFFPSAHDEQETGAKRGCVVLCQSRAKASVLSRCSSLRQHTG